MEYLRGEHATGCKPCYDITACCHTCEDVAASFAGLRKMTDLSARSQERFLKSSRKMIDSVVKRLLNPVFCILERCESVQVL